MSTKTLERPQTQTKDSDEFCKECLHLKWYHRRLVDPDSGCPVWHECYYPGCDCKEFEE